MSRSNIYDEKAMRDFCDRRSLSRVLPTYTSLLDSLLRNPEHASVHLNLMKLRGDAKRIVDALLSHRVMMWTFDKKGSATISEAYNFISRLRMESDCLPYHLLVDMFNFSESGSVPARGVLFSVVGATVSTSYTAPSTMPMVPFQAAPPPRGVGNPLDVMVSGVRDQLQGALVQFGQQQMQFQTDFAQQFQEAQDRVGNQIGGLNMVIGGIQTGFTDMTQQNAAMQAQMQAQIDELRAQMAAMAPPAAAAVPVPPAAAGGAAPAALP